VHERVVDEVSGALRGLGFAVLGSAQSPLLGPAGNREFLVAGRLV
jgi:predicted rRNA methylase YqxC with S4 and FtsJ domains